MRLICPVMHFVVSKILKYALQTFLRFIIHMIYTGFTHFCREISLVVNTRFGRHFLAKIWWEEAPKHFIGPGNGCLISSEMGTQWGPSTAEMGTQTKYI